MSEENNEQQETTGGGTETATPTIPDRLPDDHPLVKSLEQWKAEAKSLRDKVREFEDGQKSGQNELQSELETVRDDNTKKDLEIARLTAALNHGLSADDLDLLGTGTAEEITKRAERLAERLSPEPVVPSSVNQGGNGTAPQVSGEKLAEQIWSRNRI